MHIVPIPTLSYPSSLYPHNYCSRPHPISIILVPTLAMFLQENSLFQCMFPYRSHTKLENEETAHKFCINEVQ